MISGTMPLPLTPAGSAPAPTGAATVASQLEQMFLEEMLKYCGPGALSGDFSGGAGEDQFASFLTREHAAMLSQRVDLGFGRMLQRGGAA